ncbi:MAG: 4Fe-4S binding protein [Bacteroidota bacterium]
MALTINSEKCTQDHKCLMLNFCPALAITQVEFKLPEIDNDKCFECGNCKYYCKQNAVEKVVVSALLVH